MCNTCVDIFDLLFHTHLKNNPLLPYICLDIYYICMVNLHDGKLMVKGAQKRQVELLMLDVML